jgi:hypothetical protein
MTPVNQSLTLSLGDCGMSLPEVDLLQIYMRLLCLLCGVIDEKRLFSLSLQVLWFKWMGWALGCWGLVVRGGE